MADIRLERIKIEITDLQAQNVVLSGNLEKLREIDRKKCKTYQERVQFLEIQLAQQGKLLAVGQQEIARLNGAVSQMNKCSRQKQLGNAGFETTSPQLVCEIKTEPEEYNENAESDTEKETKFLGDMYNFLDTGQNNSQVGDWMGNVSVKVEPADTNWQLASTRTVKNGGETSIGVEAEDGDD